MPWLNEVKEPEPDLLVSFYSVKSGKGFVCEALQYSTFLWQSDRLAMQLCEALAVLSDCASPKQLVVIPRPSEKRGFTVELKEQTKIKAQWPIGYWALRGSGYSYIFGDKLASEENPFL